MKKEIELRNKIRALQALHGYKRDEMSVKLHMCPKTFSSRMADPGAITVRELLMMERFFDVDFLDTGIQ